MYVTLPNLMSIGVKQLLRYGDVRFLKRATVRHLEFLKM